MRELNTFHGNCYNDYGFVFNLENINKLQELDLFSLIPHAFSILYEVLIF